MNAVKRLLWWLLAGSVGGVNRGRILEELFQRPHNAHELSKLLHLDYKTIRHHLEVLEKNKLIISTGSGYGFQSTGGGSYVNINQYTEERLRMIVRFEGVNQVVAVQSGKIYPNTDYKLALRYDTNKADVFLNGENIISRTGTWTLEPLDTLSCNSTEGNETKQVLVFPTALSDDECIELTTI